jgi:recombination protein RecT
MSTATQEAPAGKLEKSTAKKTFKDLVAGDQFQTQLAAALPKHLTPDRFTRVLLTATMKNPLLLECTQESLFKGILDAAAAGVEIDGRRAHLIPYKNNNKRCYEAQLIIDYKGIAELIMRSGLVASIHADIVCENDIFEYDRGQVRVHKIDLKKDRGAMYAAYCIVSMRDGDPKCDVMSKRDIDRIRQRSRASSAGPWVTDYDEMAKKTVFRRASKWVPLSPEIRAVVEAETIDDEPVNITPKKDLAGLIGAATSTDVVGGAPAEGGAPADGATGADDKAPPKTYTPEERTVILREVETLMLDNGVTEAKVMLFVHQEKMARDGQDEVGALDTFILDGLRGIIPTLKAPAK